MLRLAEQIPNRKLRIVEPVAGIPPLSNRRLGAPQPRRSARPRGRTIRMGRERLNELR